MKTIIFWTAMIGILLGFILLVSCERTECQTQTFEGNKPFVNALEYIKTKTNWTGESVFTGNLEGGVQDNEQVDKAEYQGEATNNFEPRRTGWSFFPRGQCTWYVDGKVFYARDWDDRKEWILNFKQNYGRHAYRWAEPGFITNGNVNGTKGLKGDILVLKAWPGNPYGHVMYIYDMIKEGKQWTVRHMNMAFGDKKWESQAKAYCREAVVTKEGNYIKFSGSSKRYPFGAIVYRP